MGNYYFMQRFKDCTSERVKLVQDMWELNVNSRLTFGKKMK
jgi:hypothetical protein